MSRLLLEDGSVLLCEDGGALLLESAVAAVKRGLKTAGGWLGQRFRGLR